MTDDASYVLVKKALDLVYSHTMKNREEILQSSVCHCLYCKKSFVPSDVSEWGDDDTTARCPKCEVDAVVIGNASDFEMTPALLNELHDHWFERQILPAEFDYSLFDPLD